jgi:hypothetical protein
MNEAFTRDAQACIALADNQSPGTSNAVAKPNREYDIFSRHMLVRSVIRMYQTTWCACHVPATEFFRFTP